MAATSLLALLDDIASIVQWIAAISEMGAYLAMLAPRIANGLVGSVVGLVVGAVLVAGGYVFGRLKGGV